MKSTIGILYDRIRWEEKELASKFEKKGLQAQMIDAKMEVLPLNSSKLNQIPDLVLGRCVSYYRGLNMASALEAHGIKVINSSEVLERCGNKLLTSLILSRNGVATPKTVAAFSSQSAMKAIELIGFPCVMKPIIGSWGRQVVPIRDRETAEALIEMRDQQADSMQTIYYIQEMIKRPPRDIRCISVGENVVASVYRYSADDSWKTNVALGGHTEPCKLTSELEEIVIRASRAVGGGILGVDLMESAGELMVHEINGTVEFRGAQASTISDISEKIIDYVVSSHQSSAERGSGILVDL
jgi:[lysine-biosynthesis-protein LysW]--L-2-aminoadipate ligase